MKTKEWIIFLVIIILAIIIRTISLNEPLTGDDAVVMKIAEEKLYFGGTSSAHPPLGNIILIAITSIFGLNEWAFRLPAFLTAIGTIIVIYFFARREYDIKTAAWTALILAIAPWHIYSAKTNFGGDGVLAFFLLISSVIFLLYIHQDNWKKYIMIGIILGVVLLLKETTIILVVIFLIYMIFQRIGITEISKKLSFIFIGGTIIALIFISADGMFNNFEGIDKLIKNSIEKGVERKGYIEPQLSHYIFSWTKIFVWLTPLLLLLPIFSLCKDSQKEFKKEHRRKNKNVTLFAVIFILIYGVFVMIYLNPVFDKPRYLLVITPFLALLAGDVLARRVWTKKEIIIVGFISIIFLVSFLIINTSRNIISYDHTEEIINKVKTVDFSFDLAITSDTGNPGLVFSTWILIITYSISGICTIIYFFCRKNEYKNASFLIFISISGGYILFISQEFLFHFTSPDYSYASKQIITYAQEHNLPEPILLFKDPSIKWYLQDKYSAIYGYDNIQISDEKFQNIQKQTSKGGTILFIDIPFIDREGRLWKLFQTCEDVLSIDDKGSDIAHVFVCSTMQE